MRGGGGATCHECLIAVAQRPERGIHGITSAGLEERGLVRRRSDVDDGRRALLTVTAAGRKVLLDRRSESTGRLAAVLDAEFTAAERRRLLAVLPLLDRLAERL